MALKQCNVLIKGKFLLPELIGKIENTFTAFRLWEAEDEAVFLAQNGDKIDMLVTSRNAVMGAPAALRQRDNVVITPHIVSPAAPQKPWRRWPIWCSKICWCLPGAKWYCPGCFDADEYGVEAVAGSTLCALPPGIKPGTAHQRGLLRPYTLSTKRAEENLSSCRYHLNHPLILRSDIVIKLITVDELRLGMFIHKLEVWWIKDKRIHNQMLITDPRQIAMLHNEGIQQLCIDLDRSVQAPIAPVVAKRAIARTPFFRSSIRLS